MVDHIRTLLLNPSGVDGYRKVVDATVDKVLSLFGINGDGSDDDATRVDALLPLAQSPDLSRFRGFFDQRVTPRQHASIYRQTTDTISPLGLYSRLFGSDGWWAVSSLFNSDDSAVSENLRTMRESARCHDAPFAIGVILIACAYRRLLMQGGQQA